jgi:hypothetical protein
VQHCARAQQPRSQPLQVDPLPAGSGSGGGGRLPAGMRIGGHRTAESLAPPAARVLTAIQRPGCTGGARFAGDGPHQPCRLRPESLGAVVVLCRQQGGLGAERRLWRSSQQAQLANRSPLIVSARVWIPAKSLWSPCSTQLIAVCPPLQWVQLQAALLPCCPPAALETEFAGRQDAPCAPPIAQDIASIASAARRPDRLPPPHLPQSTCPEASP